MVMRACEERLHVHVLRVHVHLLYRPMQKCLHVSKFCKYMTCCIIMYNNSTLIHTYMHTCIHSREPNNIQILRMKEMIQKMPTHHLSLRDPAPSLQLLIARGSSQSLLGGRRTGTPGRVVAAPLRYGPGWRNCQSHSRRRSYR